MPVFITERIHPDCVCIPHGFGHTSKGLTLACNKGARGADLLGSGFDKISGNAALHEDFVQIIPRTTMAKDDELGRRRRETIKAAGGERS
jgi:hypothetical protein